MSARRFHLHLHQFFCESLRDPGSEAAFMRAARYRALDRFDGLLFAEVFQMETDPQFFGHDRRVRVHGPEIVFAHRKEHPHPRQRIQRLAQLLKEVPALLPTLRIGRKQLFELIENGDEGLRQSILVERMLTLLKHLAHTLFTDLLNFRCWRQPPYERVKDVDILDLRSRESRGRRSLHSSDRQDLKFLVVEKVPKLCVDERRLSRPGLGVKQDFRVRDNQGEQLVAFAIPPKEERGVFPFERTWSDEGLRLGVH